MKTSFNLICLLALISLTLSDAIAQTNGNKRVVQSDHFSSEQEKTVKYSIEHVDQHKSLILVLKEKSKQSDSLQTNSIDAQLASGNVSVNCTFTNYQHLCVLPQAKDSKVYMTLACRTSPCSISWILFQPEVELSPNNTNHTNKPTTQVRKIAQGLYNLQMSSRHVISRISCNDPQRKTFYEDIEVYSSNHYRRGGSNKEVYVMFSNEQKGYVYLDIKDGSSECADIKFESIPDKINYSDLAIIDFTTKSSPSSIKLDPPSKDIRIDCLFHLLHSQKEKEEKLSPVRMRLSGLSLDQPQVIIEHLIEPELQQKQMTFSVTFKKPQQSYEELKLQIISEAQQMTILDFVVTENDVQQVSLGEINYFHLKEGEKIQYRVLPIPAEEIEEETIQIVTSDLEGFATSITECSASKGCQFALLAKRSGQGYVFTQNQAKSTAKPTVQFIPIGRLYKSKGKIEQRVYLKKETKKGRAFRVNINTPNAIIYAARQDQCSLPSQTCSERMGNIHHPIFYTPEADSNFLITVVLLENCEFSVQIVLQKDEYITLEDGAAFSYTLYEKQQKLQFRYLLKQKKEVYFNLIAPLNSLVLVVQNDVQSGRQISTEGFLTFAPSDIKNLSFTILVEKTAISKNKQTHFTLIASTTDTVIQLQPAVAHYQTIKQQAYRQYVFQFDPNQQFLLNFYAHNLKQQTIKVMLAISIDRSWNSNNLEKIWFNRQADYADLNTLSAKLCKAEGLRTCQIFLRLQNQMDVQADITITLMTRNAFIQLKDGIWQSYPESSMISFTRFYFYPKHIDKNVLILYHSSITGLKMTYNLWKTDSQAITPLEWPFPDQPVDFDLSTTKSIQQVTIDKEILNKTCWPYCVILITLYNDVEIPQATSSFVKDLKIMVSNSQIEIPQKTRIEMVLKTGEQKQLIVDMKYALNKEQITFYNSRLFGDYIVFANLYSERTNRCPLDGQEISDFILKSGQNIFAIDDIQAKLKDLKIQNDSNIYMCLSVRTQKDCKFSLEYSTSSQLIKTVHLDSFEEIHLDRNDLKYYQIDGSFSFNAKIMRKSGFPFIYIKKCKENQLLECKQQLMDSKDKGKQIVSKTQEFEEEPCESCVYIFKMYAEDPAVITFHLKSKYSMLQLKQHEIISDFIQEEDQNSYYFTHVISKPLVIDIHVLSGDVQARLTDSNSLSLQKESQKNQKLIHFYIKPEITNNGQLANLTTLGESLNSPFRLSNTFRNYVLQLSKKQSNSSVIYSIVYSSGQNVVYLQDGLVTDITLEHKMPTKFIYFKESKSHIFLTISSRNVTELNNLEIEAYYYQISGDETKVEFTLQKPKMPRSGPNPTLLFLLPPKYHFEILLTNAYQKQYPISIGINHQQIMFLPFDHEYPFTLHQGQVLNFLVQVGQPGYIEVNIRKCDQSVPTFSYVEQYSSFIDGKFDNQIMLSQKPFFKELIKIKQAGTFYLNFKASQLESSMLSINLTFFKNKPNESHLRAGGRGLIEYQLISSKQALITFMPIRCKKAKCSQKIKYYAMTSPSLDHLYSQMVCPSSFFTSEQDQMSSFISKEIKVGEDEEITDYVIDLADHISYFGVKATSSSGEEIYYRPIEVITFWGQLSRTSQTHKLALAGFLVVSVCALLAFVRYNARKGYVRIDQQST